MSEYNDGQRQTKMVGVVPSSSSPLPSSGSNDQSRGTHNTGTTEPTTEPAISHRLPSTSDSTTTNNQSIYSYMQKFSTQKASGNTSHTVGGIAKTIGKTFETLINDTGYGEGLARLHLQLPQFQSQQNQPQSHQGPHQQGRFLEPIALRRHIHSTPLRRTPISSLSAIQDEGGYNSNSDSDSDEDSSPPAGLEILDSARSRSTPLTTSENSAFGTILRTQSHRVHDESSMARAGDGLGSAFSSLAPYAMTKATSRSHSAERVARPVIFNPIVHEDEILKVVDGEDVLGEMTSIEVTNVPYAKEEEVSPQRPTKKKSAFARGARFFTDNLRISGGNSSKRENAGGRFRPRDGRENPATPPSISSDEHSRSPSAPAPAPAPRTNASNDRNDLVLPCEVASSTGAVNNVSSQGKTASSDTTEHADTDLSPRTDRVCIEVNDNTDIGNRIQYSLSSPDPMPQSFGLHNHDSPDSARFPPSISNSSGRTSQGTSTSNSSNGRSHGSQLSSISETDREVANVNVLQRDRRLQVVGEQIELSLCSDRSIRSGDLNCSLSTTTPESRIRGDGASVRAERFFDYSKDSGRFRNLPPFMKRSSSVKSPTAGSCSASVYTSSSTGSDEPPKIVTYMDRKQVSDLSSLHYRQIPLETSSPRADHDQEVREASPSKQIQAEYSEIFFEGAHAGKMDNYNKPRPHWPGKGMSSHVALGRKNRSLPPRSPCNKLFSSTSPTPRGDSPLHAISPPRQIVGHQFDMVSTNLSKPYDIAPLSSHLNSPLSTELLHAPNQGSHQVVRLSPNCDYYNLKPAARGLSPVYGHQVARTYEESSIEILKTDSKDDNSIPLVTPDKGTPSP